MRKIFGTDGIRSQVNKEPMTPSIILRVGQAAALVFGKSNHKKHKVIIAKDTRVSGYVFEYALTSGLCSMGVDVYQVGPMPTPALAHLVKSFAADAGIMITASHNSIEDNGIKFFSSNGYKLHDDVEEEIECLLESPIELNTSVEKLGKAFKIEDARGRYIECVKHSIKNRSLKGFKIVLDCANGAAYRVAPLIFQELGAEVIVLNNLPNGLNINQGGSQSPERMQETVKNTKADVGIALDGDADRVVMADEKGALLDGDILLAIAAVHLKNKGKLDKEAVVTTIMSNTGFEEAMKQHGISVVKTAVGDRYVIEEMQKSGYTLGGEPAGHIIFDKHTTTGDGTLSALQILSIMQQKKKPLSELAKVMSVYPQITLNVQVKEKKPLEKIPALSEAIKAAEKKAKVLVRYSGTQNLCRITVEGKNKEQIMACSQEIAKIVQKELGA